MILKSIDIQGGAKTDTQFYFCDKFGNSAPILTILSLLQAEIYGSYMRSSSDHTFIVWPHYLAKQTLLPISVLSVKWTGTLQSQRHGVGRSISHGENKGGLHRS